MLSGEPRQGWANIALLSGKPLPRFYLLLRL